MDNIIITNPDNLPAEFIEAEIKSAEEESGRAVMSAEFYVLDDGENVHEIFRWMPIHFQRIRRITGYLVGTLDRFNDGKRAEERDRVKHDAPEGGDGE